MVSVPVHIVFCVNDAYVPYICVTIKSILENSNGKFVSVHILTDYISGINRKRLSDEFGRHKNISVRIYKVADAQLKGLRTGNLTIHTWYRLLLPEILPKEINRVLYLDADTVVVSDLYELFLRDMTGFSIAAALGPQSFGEDAYSRCGYDKTKQYVCAGVLLINLDYWRQNNLTDKIIDYARRNNEKLLFQDQDAINYICQDTKIILPLRYGTALWFFGREQLYADKSYYKQLYDSFYHPAIIHYIGCHPWQKEMAVRHIMHDQWIKYNKMLRRPVKRSYGVKFSLAVKIAVYRFLHPSIRRIGITADDVKSKLSTYGS